MMKVRSGVQASEDRVEYSITTTLAKEYLQNKFNLLTSTAKKKGLNIPEVDIMMYNEKLGKNLFWYQTKKMMRFQVSLNQKIQIMQDFILHSMSF